MPLGDDDSAIETAAPSAESPRASSEPAALPSFGLAGEDADSGQALESSSQPFVPSTEDIAEEIQATADIAEHLAPSSANAMGPEEADTPMEVGPKSEILEPKVEAEDQVDPELVEETAALSAAQESKEEEPPADDTLPEETPELSASPSHQVLQADPIPVSTNSFAPLAILSSEEEEGVELEEGEEEELATAAPAEVEAPSSSRPFNVFESGGKASSSSGPPRPSHGPGAGPKAAVRERGPRGGKKHVFGSKKKKYSLALDQVRCWLPSETYRLLHYSFQFPFVLFDRAVTHYPDLVEWVLTEPHLGPALDYEQVRYLASILPEFYGWLFSIESLRHLLSGVLCPQYSIPRHVQNPRAGQLQYVRAGRIYPAKAETAHDRGKPATEEQLKVSRIIQEKPPEKFQQEGQGWQPTLERSYRAPVSGPREPSYPPSGWIANQVSVQPRQSREVSSRRRPSVPLGEHPDDHLPPENDLSKIAHLVRRPPSPYNPLTATPEVADATARAREVFESPEAAEQLARALSSIPKDTSQPEYAVEPRFAELVEDAADHQRQQEEARQRRAVYQRLAMQDSSASSQPVPPPKPSSAVTAGSTAEPAASSSVTLIPRSRSPAARRLVSFPLRNTSRNPRPDMSRIEDSIVNVYEASDAVWLDPWNARYSQSIAVNPGAEIHELDLDSESNDERVAVEHRRRKLEGHIEEAADLNWRAIPGAAVLRPPPRGPTVAATISSRPDSFAPASADSSATAEEPPKKARTLYQPISKGDPRGIRPQLPTTPKVRLLSRDQVEAAAPAGEHQAVSVERTPEQEQPRESREDKPSRPPPVSKAGQTQATFDEQGKASSFPDPKSVGTPSSPPERATPDSGESSSIPPKRNPPDPPKPARTVKAPPLATAGTAAGSAQVSLRKAPPGAKQATIVVAKDGPVSDLPKHPWRRGETAEAGERAKSQVPYKARPDRSPSRTNKQPKFSSETADTVAEESGSAPSRPRAGMLAPGTPWDPSQFNRPREPSSEPTTRYQPGRRNTYDEAVPVVYDRQLCPQDTLQPFIQERQFRVALDWHGVLDTMLNPIGRPSQETINHLIELENFGAHIMILSFTGNAGYNTAYWDTLNFRAQVREAGVQLAGGVVLTNSPTGRGGKALFLAANQIHCMIDDRADIINECNRAGARGIQFKRADFSPPSAVFNFLISEVNRFGGIAPFVAQHQPKALLPAQYSGTPHWNRRR